MESKQVMMIAAEASSVLYAQRILETWKKNKKNIKAFGVGSQEMESLGFERLGKSEEMAIVGATEIISQYGFLKSVFNALLREAEIRRPRVVILLDYPEFNLMLAKRLYAMGIPVVYYISPQIWAWRKGRVHQIKKYCKKVFLLFPFEEEFYKAHNVNYEFVGHPILDELEDRYFDAEYLLQRRQQCGINSSDIVLGLMPGSRRLEIKQHFSIQLEVARRLSRRHVNLKIVILCAPNFSKEDLLPYLEDFQIPYQLIKDEPFNMIALTDLVLVASGTATLMVGLLQKPMVIMYRLKWLSSLIAKLLVSSKFFGLVNLVLDKEVAPERFQGDANPEVLSDLIEKYILDKDLVVKTQQELGQLRLRLGNKGATQRVVDSLEEYFT